MLAAVPPDFLDRVRTSVDSAWNGHNHRHSEADWEAIWKEALAKPCFELGYAVACSLRRPRGGGTITSEVTEFDRHPNLYQPPEQGLDLLAVEPRTLRPILGAEIEWAQEQGPRSAKHEGLTVRKVWGEVPPPRKGYLVAALYDLGRLLAFNPPYMVLDVSPPRDGIDQVVDWVERMYRRADEHRAMGSLLLSVERDDVLRFKMFASQHAPGNG